MSIEECRDHAFLGQKKNASISFSFWDIASQVAQYPKLNFKSIQFLEPTQTLAKGLLHSMILSMRTWTLQSCKMASPLCSTPPRPLAQTCYVG